MDKELHQALLNYINKLRLDRMTHYEVQVISSPLFEKSLETKSFQSHIKKMKDKKQMRFIDDPESEYSRKEVYDQAEKERMKRKYNAVELPNLMKLVLIDNPD